MDAAVHDGLDQDPHVFVLDRALVLLESAGIDAVGHGLILQIAFTTLVADRAIERVVDQQEFHHAFARLAHQWRLGEDLGRLAVRPGPAVAHAPGAGGHRLRRALQLDQAHAAVAGDREPFVEAEARDFRACGLAGLQQRVVRRDVDLFAVDDELGHRSCPLSVTRSAPISTTAPPAGFPSRRRGRSARTAVDAGAARPPPARSADAWLAPTTSRNSARPFARTTRGGGHRSVCAWSAKQTARAPRR